MEKIEILTIPNIMEMFGVGRRTAERYAKESQALLPRIKGGTYKIRKDKFIRWLKGEET